MSTIYFKLFSVFTTVCFSIAYSLTTICFPCVTFKHHNAFFIRDIQSLQSTATIYGGDAWEQSKTKSPTKTLLPRPCCQGRGLEGIAKTARRCLLRPSQCAPRPLLRPHWRNVQKKKNKNIWWKMKNKKNKMKNLKQGTKATNISAIGYSLTACHTESLSVS